MKLNLKSKVQHFAGRVRKLTKNFPPQLLCSCLAYAAYLIYTAPVMCAITLAISIFSITAISVIDRFLPMRTKAKWKYVCLLGIPLTLLSLPTPSYAFLDGFETAVTTIINATGGGVDAETAVLISTLLKIALFIAFTALVIAAFFSQQNEERLAVIIKAGITLLAAVVLLEVAGNYIFAV